ETFSRDFPSQLFPLHDVYIAAGVKVSDSVTGRLSGGVVLLVRKEFSPLVKHVTVEYDNIVVVKLSKDMLGSVTDIMLLGVYLPPANSVYYKDTEIENGVFLVEQCILDIQEQFSDVSFLLCGDLNARTGDRFPCGDSLPDDFVDMEPSNMCSVTDSVRTSKDCVINAFGTYLLSVCEQFDLVILNGVLSGDCSGDYLYRRF
ncbi:hypothetical protein BaRGS_00021471, partial [Batillaria attramentaria]